MLSRINKYHNVHFGHESKAKYDTFWSGLCLHLCAAVQSPEEADQVLNVRLEVHQSQVCCHLKFIICW